MGQGVFRHACEGGYPDVKMIFANLPISMLTAISNNQ
jgi:hypothetical protein